MEEPLEDAYFNWLYTKVASHDVPTPSNTYYKLLRDLHGFAFVWLLSGDDNRAEDGKDLRKEFLRQANIHDVDKIFNQLECSILEMLIAMSRAASTQTMGSPREWFWAMLDNLELSYLNDASYRRNTDIIPILERVVWRTYERTGLGGLFPLRHPPNDQRKTELWYQFQYYIEENNIE